MDNDTDGYYSDFDDKALQNDSLMIKMLEASKRDPQVLQMERAVLLSANSNGAPRGVLAMTAPQVAAALKYMNRSNSPRPKSANVDHLLDKRERSKRASNHDGVNDRTSRSRSRGSDSSGEGTKAVKARAAEFTYPIVDIMDIGSDNLPKSTEKAGGAVAFMINTGSQKKDVPSPNITSKYTPSDLRDVILPIPSKQFTAADFYSDMEAMVSNSLSQSLSPRRVKSAQGKRAEGVRRSPVPLSGGCSGYVSGTKNQDSAVGVGVAQMTDEITDWVDPFYQSAARSNTKSRSAQDHEGAAETAASATAEALMDIPESGWSVPFNPPHPATAAVDSLLLKPSNPLNPISSATFASVMNASNVSQHPNAMSVIGKLMASHTPLLESAGRHRKSDAALAVQAGPAATRTEPSQGAPSRAEGERSTRATRPSSASPSAGVFSLRARRNKEPSLAAEVSGSEENSSSMEEFIDLTVQGSKTRLPVKESLPLVLRR